MQIRRCLLIVIFIEAVSARAHKPDIDTNRLDRLPYQDSRVSPPVTSPSRRSIDLYRSRSNDYDDHSSGLSESRLSQIRYVYDASTTDAKTPIKVHQPREDPRLYYQSDAYIKEIRREKVNDEVKAIYPGTDVVRADNDVAYRYRFLPSRARYQKQRQIEGSDLCIRCPHDRTLIAKTQFNHVIFQSPVLRTCSGHLAPESVRLVHKYGPKFGSLLGQGTHVIVGQIMQNNKVLQSCKMQVYVLLQNCPTPKYLNIKCEEQNKPCNFSCRDHRLEVYGPSSLTCRTDMKWDGDLPICKARTWCQPPPPPDHGHVTCKGSTDDASGLAEGSRCRVRCARGYRTARTAAVCRRGVWTHALICQPKRNN